MATKKKESKLTGLEALYSQFLAKLSSSERESIEKMGIAHAMPAFRKFLNSLSEPEMAEAVGKVEAPETPEEEVGEDVVEEEEVKEEKTPKKEPKEKGKGKK